MKNTKKSFIIENKYVSIEVAKNNSKILSVKDADGNNIKGDNAFFFEFLDAENNAFAINEVSLDGNVATVKSEAGQVELTLEEFDDHFIFEIVKADVTDKVRYFNFANVNFEYDTEDENALRAATVSMTVNTNPRFYPDGVHKCFAGQAMPHLGGLVGAKLGATVVPAPILRSTLKVISKKIDPDKGIVSKIAGAWALDHQPNFGDYIITNRADAETIRSNIDYCKELGIDQLDFHQGPVSFRQGDFKYMAGNSMEDFRKNVSEFLNEHGIVSGLHTYSYYITFRCGEILSDPEKQKQLETDEVFTLAEDISAEDTFIPAVESTAELTEFYGFFSKNLPYCLIGEEIIKYTNHPQGFTVVERGFAGTKASAHKKGEKIYHLTGLFNLFCPRPGTPLFKEIAHNTAKAYNEGGFDMIYLDALDGIGRHCKHDEEWYWCAKFVHEILKNCDHPPLIEYSTMYPSIWAARARSGAWDTPSRAYKNFNMAHHRENAFFRRCHYTSTLGWYDYYPINENYPGNHHTKYHHWDSIDHMGTLALAYNYSTVFSDLAPQNMDRYAGYNRNIKRYRMYSHLRKSHYFKDSTLKKLRASKHEFAVTEKNNGKYALVEKNYSIKRLYDIQNYERNTTVLSNPFKAQTPFIRLENCLSTLAENPMILLPLDENKPLSEQLKSHEFGGRVDIKNHLAIKVRVKGNGKNGKIAITTRFETNSATREYALYLIDTDFEGWRDFVLYETDNGTRVDEHSFEKDEHAWKVFRNQINTDRLLSIELRAEGDIDGVQMSSVQACAPIYNVIKNPTVKVGEEKVMFECELMSSDFIEYDGEKAKVVDRYGNEKPVWFDGSVTVPHGKYKAEVSIASSLNNCPANVILTVGTTGKEIK